MNAFKTALVAISSVALLSTSVEAHAKTPFALKRTRETLDRLEVRYGKGLTGLRDENGKLSGKALGWGKKGGKKHGLLSSDISVTIPGTSITIDAGTAAASFMGVVYGMQYQGTQSQSQYGLQEESITNCFASSYNIVEATDNLAYDFNNLGSYSGEFRWFNTFIADPAKYTADLSVLLEMCDFYTLTNKVMNVASLDYSNMAELGTNAVVFSFTDLPSLMSEFDALYIDVPCPDEIIDEVAGEEGENGTTNDGEDDDDDDDFNFDDFSADKFLDTNFQNDDFDFENEVLEGQEKVEEIIDTYTGCFADVDQFAWGEIVGKIFTKYTGDQLKPIA